MDELENRIKNINHNPIEIHTRQIWRGQKQKKKRKGKEIFKKGKKREYNCPGEQNSVIQLVLGVFWSVY